MKAFEEASHIPDIMSPWSLWGTWRSLLWGSRGEEVCSWQLCSPPDSAHSTGQWTAFQNQFAKSQFAKPVQFAGMTICHRTEDSVLNFSFPVPCTAVLAAGFCMSVRLLMLSLTPVPRVLCGKDRLAQPYPCLQICLRLLCFLGEEFPFPTQCLSLFLQASLRVCP